MGDLDIIEHYLSRQLFWDKCRRNAINSTLSRINPAGGNEEEALGRLLWHTSFLEPPLSNEELLCCRALLCMSRLFDCIAIDSLKEVLEILEIPPEKISLPREDLVKAVKRAYWERVNQPFDGFKSYWANIRQFVIITKAFKYIVQ